MKTCRMVRLVVGILAGGVALTGEAEAKPLRVVATTGMVGDLVEQIGGDRVEVETLMGPGVDPHVYKPTPADAAALSKADVIFYTGLKLEGRMEDLFGQLRKGGKKVFAIAESLPEERLLKPTDYEGNFDPHIWFDVSLWAETVPAVVAGLSEADPEHAAAYAEGGARVSAELAELQAWVEAKVAELPKDQRVLVTSHDAYGYFGRAYGFQVVGLQGVSTTSEAALSDMTALVDFVKAQGVKAIFVESSVNPAAIRRVAADAGVSVGGELFSDAMGMPGEMKDGFDVGTYDGMVKYNLTTMVEGLK